MHAATIASAFGKPFESAEVQAVVESLALTRTPRAKSKEPKDYLPAKKHGIELSFIDADFMSGKPVARYGKAPMLLVATTLYTGEQKQAADFKRSVASLPDATAFSDSPEELTRKLGPPSSMFEDEGIVYNRLWRRGDYALGFNYGSTGILEYVQLIWLPYMDRL